MAVGRAGTAAVVILGTLSGIAAIAGMAAFAGRASLPAAGPEVGGADRQDAATSVVPRPDRSPEAPRELAEPSIPPPPAELSDLVDQERAAWGRDFYFTRAIYSGGGRGWRRGASWSIDFPKADRQFLFILRRLLDQLDAYEWENPVRLDDPELRRYPFLYALEVGYMDLTEPEVAGLRGYLEAGGFLVIDDFWGEREWANFEFQMSRVLPDREIRPIPLDHPIFHQFYDIEEVLQVPNVGNGMRGGPYEECWGCAPAVLGIFDDRDELMVVINFNTDLGDAWEWSENPYYPIDRSNYAYEMAINLIIYAMSH